MTLLPKDNSNHPIPAVRLKDGGAHSVSVTATAAKNSTAFAADTLIVSVYSTVGIFMTVGDSTVVADANDHFFPAGVYYDFAIRPEDTHFSVIRESTDGTVYFSEKE